jgi:hypothetical protein
MDLTDFTGEHSDVAFTKYNVDSTLGAKVLGYPVAIATDIGTSIWNSLTPERYNVDTGDVLRGINENAANIYAENEDTVKTLSFVGGLILPQGIALKGMKALRAGAKGFNWFSEAGEVARVSGIKTAIENSGRASDAVRGLVWQNRFFQGTNALVDSAVLEGVMLLTMNAHPFMEDYLKDPFKNMGINIMFGTGLIGAGNIIMGNRAVKLAAMDVSKRSNETLLGTYEHIDPTLNYSSQMTIHMNNSDNWKNAIANRPDLTPHTKELLRFNSLNSEARAETVFDSMLSPSIPNYGKEWRDTWKGRIAADPERFAGIDYIDLPRMPDVVDINAAAKKSGLPPILGEARKDYNLFDSTTVPGQAIPLARETATGAVARKTVVYSPTMDKFMSPREFRYYGTAVDLGYTPETLIKSIPKNYHLTPNMDIGLESIKSSGAVLDANFLRGLMYYSDRPIMDFNGAKLASDDFGMIQGLVTRLQNETFSGVGVPADFRAYLVTHKGTQKAVTSEELYQYLQNAKKGEVQTMLSNGIPDDIIARYTNVPVDTIQKVQAGANINAQELGWSTYTNASSIADYLSPNNRAVAFHTNINKIPHAQFRVNNGIRITQSTDDLVKEGILANSRSAYIRDWAEYLLGGDFRTMRDVVRNQLSVVANESMGTRFLGSADFAMRDMGDLGSIFTRIGKDVTHMSNVAMDKMFATIKDDVLKIARNDVLRVEHNTALNVNAGIRGYRIFKDGQFWVPSKIDASTMEAVAYNGAPFIVQSPEVRAALEGYAELGKDFYIQANTIRGIPGAGKIQDIGFWVPSFNPKDKFIAYVFDKSTQETTLLHGKTQGELEDAIRAFETLPGVQSGRTHDIVRKGTDQKLWNTLNGRHDPMFMTSADVSMLKTGSSQAARVSTSTEQLVDIINAYENQVKYNVKSLTELMMSDVFDHLRTYSSYNQSATAYQPISKLKQLQLQPKDSAATVMNTLLGKANLDQSLIWSGVNQTYSAVVEKILGTIASTIEPVINVAKGSIGKGETLSNQKYTEMIAELERKGISNPFAGFAEADARRQFHLDRTLRTEDLTPRMTVLVNSLAATTLLKVGELGQAFVNAISLPILMTSEISSKLPAQFMGTAKNDAEFGVIKTMYNGWRYAHSDAVKPYLDYGKAHKLFEGVVSEADELFAQTRAIEGGVITKVEEAMKSRLVGILSKPTEFSENFVREKAFATGVYIAKEAYPGLHDAGVITFARDFMDRTIGNYSAAQRPTMFQGSAGVAMGLFQTYMVTIAQSLYKHVEKGEFKALAKTMLMQGGIFGARSLPGFNIVSEAIGEHFSDKNVDLTTGLYRGLPDEIATMILYGMPSSFGPAITTRGEIQPRIPDPTQGINMIPAVNLTTQAFDAMKKVGKAVFTADENAGGGVLEALSMQSISRPIARLSELASGYATTSRGNVVATPEEVWTWPSLLARGLAVRPIDEVRTRDALHLDSMYGSIDRDRRKAITMRLRTHLRDGTLDPEVVSTLGEEYMRTGSPAGWNSIVNTAIAQTNTPINSTVRNYLAPNSPGIAMINNMY